MNCIYCPREINKLEAYNNEMNAHFIHLGINSFKPYEILPEEVTEIQCSCGAWNKLED